MATKVIATGFRDMLPINITVGKKYMVKEYSYLFGYKYITVLNDINAPFTCRAYRFTEDV